MTKENLRIVFMGTPTFASHILEKIILDGYHVVAVVTASDKPAGRGKKLHCSPVKSLALEQNIPVLQPLNLKNIDFLDELNSFHADLQIVVAFRMLPPAVWQMPPMGTFNLHASLLPDYRGAAPINWAIINGEKSTGVTTFFIDKNIDTGRILLNREVAIDYDMDAGQLHDVLNIAGANLSLETIDGLLNQTIHPVEQAPTTIIKLAPKLYKPDTKIDWHKPVEYIYNFVRGLSPSPTAWTELSLNDRVVPCKIYKTRAIIVSHNHDIGSIYLEKSQLKIAAKNGFIAIEEAQLQGKNRQSVKDLLNGFRNFEHLKVLIS